MVYLIDNVKDNSMLDIMIIGNVIFLSAFSTKFCNECGFIAAIEFCITHFILRVRRDEDSGKEIFYNIGIMVFCLLSLSTLNGRCIFKGFDFLGIFANCLKINRAQKCPACIQPTQMPFTF